MKLKFGGKNLWIRNSRFVKLFDEMGTNHQESDSNL